jgi:hypothetical protein
MRNKELATHRRTFGEKTDMEETELWTFWLKDRNKTKRQTKDRQWENQNYNI